jgi:hypothetical protein
MTGKSTSVPKIAASAGLLVAAVGSFTADGTVTYNKATLTDIALSTSSWHGAIDSSIKDARSGNGILSFAIEEEWSNERHLDELRSLIVKKATSKSGLPAKDARRLETLQRMRRESLPVSMSYEEFMAERERRAELMRLTDALLAYEQKYGKRDQG